MLEMEIIEPNMIEMEIAGQTPSTIGGTTNYNELSGKPKINGIELKGDKTLDELNIASKDYVEQEIATFDFIKIVSELPETGLQNRTYLVTKENATENDLYDEYLWVNKGTEEEPNWIWEYQGTKTIEVDLTDYVKFTDIASGDKAGVVKVNNTTGIGISPSTQRLYVAMAGDADINNKNSNYKPIVPKNLDYAIKAGLSNNSLEWTDTEKASARELIGVGLAKVGVPGLLTGTNTYGISINGSGGLTCNILSYEEYVKKTTNAFVSVGTLKNVIDETVGDIETLLGGI